MKIVAGEYGGRTLVMPKTRLTRPMSHKVRAALFDSLGPVTGLRVVDAYAGSGAVGMEALSRGAAQVDAVEAARASLQAIEINRQALGLDWGYSLHPVKVERWLADSPKPGYDLVLADPPYADVAPDILEQLGGLLKPGGRLALSHSSKESAPLLEGLTLGSTKTYGDSALSFYQK